MEKKDQIILGAAALAVLGVMLPWFQVSAFGITVSASGFKTTPGIIGLLAIGAGGYMAYKKMKEAFYAGVAACAIGLLTILDVFELTMGDFDVSAKDLGKALGIDIGFGMGLYLYIAGSAAFTYFAYQDFQAKKEEN